MLRGGVRPIHTREATQAKKGSPPSRTRRSSPTGKVIGIANGIPEAKNDETIIRYDCNVQRITEVSYNLRNPDGVQVEHKRGHLLDDGGYHKVGRVFFGTACWALCPGGCSLTQVWKGEFCYLYLLASLSPTVFLFWNELSCASSTD